MIRCLIVEDDDTHREHLERTLKRLDGYEATSYTDKACEIYDILETQKDKEEPIDLIFLDISLKDGESAGEDFFKNCSDYPDMPKIVIVSTPDTIARSGAEWYDPGHLAGFLKKGITYSRLEMELNRLFPKESLETRIKVSEDKNHVIIRYNHNDDSILTKVLFEDISYISTDLALLNSGYAYPEVRKNHIRVFTTNPNDDEYIIQKSLTQFSKELPDYMIQIHQSYVINIHKIKSIYANCTHVRLEGIDRAIPIGRTFRSNLKMNLPDFRDEFS